MKLDGKALGFTLGILWGVSVLLATWGAIVLGGGNHLQLLNRVYLGYSISPLGSILGLVYGFIDGFIGGWVLAFLYNKFATKARG